MKLTAEERKTSNIKGRKAMNEHDKPQPFYGGPVQRFVGRKVIL